MIASVVTATGAGASDWVRSEHGALLLSPVCLTTAQDSAIVPSRTMGLTPQGAFGPPYGPPPGGV